MKKDAHKEFDTRVLKDEDIQKYLVKTKEPISLLKILTKNLSYQFLYEPKAHQQLSWKCWVTSRTGVTICARDCKKKGAMRKVALKALAELFSVDLFQSS